MLFLPRYPIQETAFLVRNVLKSRFPVFDFALPTIDTVSTPAATVCCYCVLLQYDATVCCYCMMLLYDTVLRSHAVLAYDRCCVDSCCYCMLLLYAATVCCYCMLLLYDTVLEVLLVLMLFLPTIDAVSTPAAT
eukprot:3941766-Rhodomonas_salina.1